MGNQMISKSKWVNFCAKYRLEKVSFLDQYFCKYWPISAYEQFFLKNFLWDSQTIVFDLSRRIRMKTVKKIKKSFLSLNIFNQ